MILTWKTPDTSYTWDPCNNSFKKGHISALEGKKANLNFDAPKRGFRKLFGICMTISIAMADLL